MTLSADAWRLLQLDDQIDPPLTLQWQYALHPIAPATRSRITTWMPGIWCSLDPVMAKKSRSRPRLSGVASADRLLLVLTAFESGDRTVELAELARRTGLVKIR